MIEYLMYWYLLGCFVISVMLAYSVIHDSESDITTSVRSLVRVANEINKNRRFIVMFITFVLIPFIFPYFVYGYVK